MYGPQQAASEAPPQGQPAVVEGFWDMAGGLRQLGLKRRSPHYPPISWAERWGDAHIADNEICRGESFLRKN